MNMTVAKLTKLNACPEGIQYFKDHKFKTVEQAITEILKTNHSQRLSWSNWLISYSLSKMNCTRYAIYAAEQVIDIVEKEYPEDKRPREAIQAVKRYLKNPSKENKEKCEVVDAASWATAKVATINNVATWYASWVAIAAAWTVNMADVASRVKYTANAAIWAANANWATIVISNKDKMLEKIIKYGVKLLKNQ
jgi:hypothetical protein